MTNLIKHLTSQPISVLRPSLSRFALLTGLCFVLLPGQASAATVIARFDVDLFATAVERTVDGTNWFSTTLGIFQFSRTGGDFTGFNVSTFYAVCIEPREFVSVGSTYTFTWDTVENGTTNIGGMGATRANMLRELYARYFPVFANTLNADTAGALQAATWEIVRETSGTLNLLTGNTRFRNAANPNALTLGQTYLNSLTGNGPYLTNLAALTNPNGVQDLLVQIPTPEPATFALVGFCLLLPAIRRKRK